MFDCFGGTVHSNALPQPPPFATAAPTAAIGPLQAVTGRSCGARCGCGT
jgi:hypothetical protein